MRAVLTCEAARADFTHTAWWKGPGAPILFYFGNEDNVELYVNHTGLMWEAARPLGAALVFAEHRYYGESLLFAPGTPGCMRYLTSEQAMADFAHLLYGVRDEWKAWSSPVIGFGGSYGGMLAAWFRIKYPNAIDGVLAASAPIWSFVGLEPRYDFNAFYKIVTRDASTAGGATDHCKANVKRGLQRILKVGTTVAGKGALQQGFRLCAAPRNAREVYLIKEFVEGPWATMAMGDYPYASTYLMHGKALLPAWPVRTACQPLDTSLDGDHDLFDALRRAVSIFHNASGDAGHCFNVTGQPSRAPSPHENQVSQLISSSQAARRHKMTSPIASPRPASVLGHVDGRATVEALDVGSAIPQLDLMSSRCMGDWGYQWCTEMVQPFTAGTADDMFYPYAPYDYNASAQDCQRSWGVMPREAWARIGLGGKRIRAASNILFSNGQLDPWSGGGILKDISLSLPAVVIPSGAHHIDLMFSDPADPADVTAARAKEMSILHGWMEEAAAVAKNM